jgi:hypothetical protein
MLPGQDIGIALCGTSVLLLLRDDRGNITHVHDAFTNINASAKCYVAVGLLGCFPGAPLEKPQELTADKQRPNNTASVTLLPTSLLAYPPSAFRWGRSFNALKHTENRTCLTLSSVPVKQWALCGVQQVRMLVHGLSALSRIVVRAATAPLPPSCPPAGAVRRRRRCAPVLLRGRARERGGRRLASLRPPAARPRHRPCTSRGRRGRRRGKDARVRVVQCQGCRVQLHGTPSGHCVHCRSGQCRARRRARAAAGWARDPPREAGCICGVARVT